MWVLTVWKPITPSHSTKQTTDIMPTPNSSNIKSNSSSNSTDDLSFCVVWSPLPPITWIIPFIGHTGIADSRGVASDFRGPYFVGDDGRMAFGPPTRAIKMDVGDLPGGVQRWDQAINEANEVYRGRMHNLFCDNCHSHVSCALNRMPMKAYDIEKWNMVKLCFLVFFRARFLSWSAALAQFLPAGIVIAVVVIFTNLT